VISTANIVLNGSKASFVDAAGKDALVKLATNTPSGSFSILGGRNFTTAENFTNNGGLTVGSGSKFDVNGTLSNFSGTTLTSGMYNVSGTLQFNGCGLLPGPA
jgi:hypothetical protein